MQPLLYLGHRLPYPPNKGDKIRSYHLLRYLSRHYKVFLGTFADIEGDAAHVSALREHCAEVKVIFWVEIKQVSDCPFRGGNIVILFFYDADWIE